MRDKEIIKIDGRRYEYVEFYKRLQSKSDIAPAIRCPECYSGYFQIEYGEWECIAVCSCGHKMTVYDG